jgi:hypothetical protein
LSSCGTHYERHGIEGPTIGIVAVHPTDRRIDELFMPPSRVSLETERRIALLFPPDQRELVRAILSEECGNNLPFLNDLDEVKLERFQFAALKLSAGHLDKFDHAIALAKRDWRDLLMAAGFGEDVNAHASWLPKQMWG